MELINIYETKDQFIASTLFAFDFKVTKIEWRGRECFFSFGNEVGCREIVQKYYAGELKIDPRILFDGFKAVKSMLFNSR